MNKKKCAYCNKAGWRQCDECDGKGYNKKVNSISCSLYGKAMFERIKCEKCNGTGKVPCKFCGGIGWIINDA